LDRSGTIPTNSLNEKSWNFSVGQGSDLFKKLDSLPTHLEDITDRIFQGLKTGADKIYIVEEIERKKNCIKIYSKENDSHFWVEQDLLHPLIKGGDSKRYSIEKTVRLILFPYKSQNDIKVSLIPELDLKKQTPKTHSYLVQNKPYLENREHGIVKGDNWYAYTRNQALDVISKAKIFTPDIAAHSSFSLDEKGDQFFTGGVAGGYGILVKPSLSTKYILGLLNSRLLEWFLQKIATQMRGGYFSYESRFIKYLPIKLPDPSIESEQANHDQIVLLVDQMLDLNKKLPSAKTADEKTRLEREIKATDNQIDQLVYQLYGLTEEEIKIVEGEASSLV